MSPPRPVDVGSVRASMAAAATAASAAFPPSRRRETAASEASFWLVAAIPDVTVAPEIEPPAQPAARGRAAAPARNSRRVERISLLYAPAAAMRDGYFFDFGKTRSSAARSAAVRS